MKKAMLFTLLFFVFCWSYAYSAGNVVRTYFINTADATVAWDEVASPDLAGFRLYTQPVGGTAVVKTEIVGGDKRQFIWVGFPSGQFLAWLTAYDKYGNESDPSETIQVNKSTTKPAIPTNNKVVGATVVINMP